MATVHNPNNWYVRNCYFSWNFSYGFIESDILT